MRSALRAAADARMWGLAWLALAIVAPLSCFNPFFPPTGKPSQQVEALAPATLLDRLMTAYENQRIDLYEDLFLINEFRFYVSPNFQTEYQTRSYANPIEDIDSQYTYIWNNGPQRSYYYWVYTNERQSTENLFNSASQITFAQRLEAQSVSYTLRSDSIGRVDTALAEVVVAAGGAFEAVANSQLYDVDVGRQVFYLKKDTRGLWKVFKWFDLNTTY